MATANTVSNDQATATAVRADLLILIAPMPPEQMESILENLATEFRGEDLLVATANDPTGTAHPEIRVLPVQATNAVWPIAAVEIVNAVHVAKENEAKAVLLLGPGADSLNPSALRGLVNSVAESKSDLAVPHYSLPPNAGLVNSAIIYPLSRALFASRVRFPLSIDMAVSPRMAERLGSTAQKFVNQNQPDAIVWPVSEAMLAGLTIDEVDVGARELPQPAEPNINAILSLVTGSLFADIESKAAFWQRPRRLLPEHRSFSPMHAPDGAVDIAPMVEAFRLAFTNLQEIWGLVLAPGARRGRERGAV